jgi:DNA modification methylase
MSIDHYDKYNLIFADFIYENSGFLWIDKYWGNLNDDGIFIAMTDFHTIFELGVKLKSMPNSFLVNHIAWKNEWGNHPKRMMHQCFDDILIFSKGKNYKFYSDRIQIPKATAKTKLNPSGRQTKTATAFCDDICLTTTSKERIKDENGKLVRWQKPLKLMQRIIDPFTDEGDWILDLFAGTATLGEWSISNNRNYVGFENDPKIWKLARNRLNKIGEKNND